MDEGKCTDSMSMPVKSLHDSLLSTVVNNVNFSIIISKCD